MVKDEPLLSPVRLWFAFRWWQWYNHNRAPNQKYLRLRGMLVYYRRPHAAHEARQY